MTTPEQTQALAQRFIHALNHLEDQGEAALDELLELFADDARLRNPMLQRELRELRGREHIADFWRQYRGAFGTIHSDLPEITANDHAAGLFWPLRALPVRRDATVRLRGTGRRKCRIPLPRQTNDGQQLRADRTTRI